MEVLKQSSSGSKALQQVLPRIRPPNLASDFSDEGFEELKLGGAKYSTPVQPNNPIYSIAAGSDSGSGTSDSGDRKILKLNSATSRPGFYNNRKNIGRLISDSSFLLLFSTKLIRWKNICPSSLTLFYLNHPSQRKYCGFKFLPDFARTLNHPQSFKWYLRVHF